jgi:hypothetical protein
VPGSHWLIALSPENYEISRTRNFDVLGLKHRHRRKAERMVPGDRLLYYVLEERIIPVAATVTSTYFEERDTIWVNTERKDDPFPFRVHTEPNIALNPYEGLDAADIAPRLSYLKRWAPERWHLALLGSVHLLSAQDFQLIEGEMQRVIDRRANGSKRQPASVR